jgi:hypothetical protein
MVPVSPEEAATFDERSSRVCVASALTLASGAQSSLEPVQLPADCNRLMITFYVISFPINPTGTLYLLGANNPDGAWTVAATYNFNGFGFIALTPPSSGFGFSFCKLVMTPSSGPEVLGDVCIWFSPA